MRSEEENNEWKIIIVYRRNNPYPIRHEVTSHGYSTEEDFFKWYYRTFKKFDDDEIKVFDTYDEAYKFVEELKRRASE